MRSYTVWLLWNVKDRYQTAGEMLEADALEKAAPTIAAHHERYSGRGYPAGLARTAIPLGARIVAIANVYDALTTAWPYKHAFSHAEANLCEQRI